MTTTYDIIFVDGPPGSGKTTLIEHLLTSASTYDLAVARVRPGPSGTRKKRSLVDADQARYKAAGAGRSAMLYAVPDRSFGDLDEIHRFEDESRGVAAVIYEGAPVTRSLGGELSVYVARPLPDGEKLVSFGEKVVTRLDLDTYLSVMSGKAPKDRELEEPPADLDGSDWVVVKETKLPDDVGKQLVEWAENGVPIKGEAWSTRPDHEGVVYGDVYVINVHNERERPAAQELAREIRKIRGDWEILRSFHGIPHASRRISVFIANLADRQDAELKKVLARLKRGLVRGGSSSSFFR